MQNDLNFVDLVDVRQGGLLTNVVELTTNKVAEAFVSELNIIAIKASSGSFIEGIVSGSRPVLHVVNKVNYRIADALRSMECDAGGSNSFRREYGSFGKDYLSNRLVPVLPHADLALSSYFSQSLVLLADDSVGVNYDIKPSTFFCSYDSYIKYLNSELLSIFNDLKCDYASGKLLQIISELSQISNCEMDIVRLVAKLRSLIVHFGLFLMEGDHLMNAKINYFNAKLSDVLRRVPCDIVNYNPGDLVIFNDRSLLHGRVFAGGPIENFCGLKSGDPNRMFKIVFDNPYKL